IGFFLGAVAIVPAVLAYLLGVLFSLDFSVFKDTWRLLAASIAYGLVIVLSAGTLMLALSSLSRSSRYVALFWVGIWIISGTVGTILSAMHEASAQSEAIRAEMQQQQQQQQQQQRPPAPGGQRRGFDQQEWMRMREKA